MRELAVIAAFVACALAGCTGGEPANPSLAAPKLVMQARSDGQVAVFVHAAFGERLYEWIDLTIDNGTSLNRTDAFSLESNVPATAFSFHATAGTSREMYEIVGRADLDLTRQRAVITLQDDEGDWGDPHEFTLPFERVMPRRATA